MAVNIIRIGSRPNFVGRVWFALNGGNWNGWSGSNPITGEFGMPLYPIFNEGLIQPLYPTIQGSGDYVLSVNFGGSTFEFGPPLGFTGCPTSGGGGATHLDPLKTFGSAILSGGNLEASFPTTAGMSQALDGYTDGKHYFEIKFLNGDFFSIAGGGGVGVDYSKGGSFSSWVTGGGFAGEDINGGVRVATSNGAGGNGTGYIAGFTSPMMDQVFRVLNAGDIIQVAFDLTFPSPPVSTGPKFFAQMI